MTESPARPSRLRTLLGWGVLVAALAVSVAAPVAQPTADATLSASHGDLLGYAVAIDGDRALVGAPGDDATGSASGAAYLYVRTDAGWTRTARLALDDAAAGDYFGISVALDGDRALVGAYGRDGGRGVAYVFERVDGTWVRTAELALLDATPGDRFGVSVALDGGRALVGAYGRDGGRGAAYVFERAAGEWAEAGRLALEDGAAGDRFGWSVALDGDRALVGAYGRSGGRGAAVAYGRTDAGWAEEARFSGSAVGDNFGVSVALDGGRALIGAPFSDTRGTDSGAAAVFVRTGAGWTEGATLTAADAEPQDRFGWSVALDGDRALVGVPLGDDDATNGGLAVSYVWAPSGWAEEERFGGATASAAAGWSVALDARHALVGAPYGPGAARMFGVEPLAAACAPGVRLAIGTFDPGADAGDEHVQIVNGADRTVDLGGCWIAALDPHTRAVSYAAPAAGAVRAGGAFTFATSGGDQDLPAASLPDGPGAVVLVSGSVGVGDPVEAVLPRLVAAVAYERSSEVARLGGGQDVEQFAAAFDRLATPTEPAPSTLGALAVAPNPTAGTATVTLRLDRPAAVRVAVYDALGREVAVLADRSLGVGSHRLDLQGRGLPAGLYVVRAASGGAAQTVRLTVIR